MYRILETILLFITLILRSQNIIMYLIMLNTLFIFSLYSESRKYKKISYKKYYVVHGIIFLIILANYLYFNSYLYVGERYIFGIALLEVLDLTYRKIKIRKQEGKKLFEK